MNIEIQNGLDSGGDLDLSLKDYDLSLPLVNIRQRKLLYNENYGTQSIRRVLVRYRKDTSCYA